MVEVEYSGFILVRGGTIYIVADDEESWVFQLPQGHGYLYFSEGGDAIWAPSLEELAQSYLEASLREVLEYVKHERGYWEKEAERYKRLIDRLKRGELKPMLVSYDDLEELMGRVDFEKV